MARLDDLIAQVADKALRQRLAAALADIKRRQKFGLVFEPHIPETSALVGFPISVGATVQRRSDLEGRHLYQVIAVSSKDRVRIEPEGGGAAETAAVGDLMLVRRFGDPIFPGLTSLGALQNGPAEKPFHAVINGENFHALQLFVYLLEDQVDCIYIDPPYNSGASDWKYNNRYVDKKDGWRHSKWLSFMEKRLRLAKRLLKPNGVLVVTVDENEVHHLGMLLEKQFADARRQMVTICINPSGVSGDGLSRVDEYAFVCFFGTAYPVSTPDDMLTEASETNGQSIEWESLLRRGNTWYRKKRKNLCYPIIIDPATQRIVGVGEPFAGENEKKRVKSIKRKPVAWPVRKDGRLGIWRVDGKRLMSLVEQGYAYVSSRDDVRGTWTIKYLMTGAIAGIKEGSIEVTGHGPRGEVVVRATKTLKTTPKTMWHRGRHTAGGAGGTQAVAAFLGERDVFPFPKSVYAVRDCIAAAIGDRPNALILDFFAGSGTTLHATCLLNAADGGSRRCVLVTNNEVSEQEAKHLATQGRYRGDPEFERHGIFEKATRPRCEAVITGRRPDGALVDGEYLDGRPYAEGFAENVEFFRIDYLDPDDVDLGNQFAAILPCLWLGAGAMGHRRCASGDPDFCMSPDSRYAVLFKEKGFRRLCKVLEKRPDITHVWIVTDSEDAFAEMRSALPSRLMASMLYRDYLRNFRINTRQNL